ncbi:unnamed protein product [Acanthoscelides obtectus]|uniref:Uncharacterized protein n=1 Tax=Acanthoscelides obtectus TaxID=200917 RepID=A0A9P0KG64_ACAOB|nr:unnamed protein product [Acanthoscelides obtectus]CAK1624751.1 hypothetical protein AOBTE_LOCUS2739 [Acanthoscelides obtectus]
MKFSLIFFGHLVLTLICYGNASSILFLEAICCYSHYTLGWSIASELASRGHQVTLVAAYKQQDTHTNLKQIVINTCTTWQGAPHGEEALFLLYVLMTSCETYIVSLADNGMTCLQQHPREEQEFSRSYGLMGSYLSRNIFTIYSYRLVKQKLK